MPKKILFIDDEPGDREWAKQQLITSGALFEFLEADTGEEGIEKARKFHPDIIIIDVQLPRMDGFEACKSIKAIKGLNTKIIVLTGKLNCVDVLKARKAGAIDFCVKTSDWKPLWQALKALI